MARRRMLTGNKQADVVNPVFQEAEARVFAYLQRIATAENPLVDVRGEKTYHDFRLGPYTLDVKCDQYALNTGRVAWEEFIFVNRGASHIDKHNGWGTDARLDYLAYVFPKADDVLWPCLLMHRRKMQLLIQAAVDTPAQRELKAFMKESGEKTATGYAVNILWLRENGCLLLATEV